ncbi:MAG TPA: protein translocase subunit SecF [Anaerolineales bacterium]|nr:protein translocase subunit SecF [Anaerolineales bacterium]
MIDFVGKRYWYFAFSLLIILPGVIGLAFWGLPLSIDFQSGARIELQFPDAQPNQIQTTDIKESLASLGLDDSIVQLAPDNIVIIRSAHLDDGTRNLVVPKLEEAYGTVVVRSFDNVGPAVGAEVARNAAFAVAAAAVGILAYMTYAFWGVPHAFRYGVAAIVAMLHDVLLMIGVASIFGKFLGWEVDALYLTALLTVIGFSVHDTIVVFDRIRENQRVHRRAGFEAIVNHSIVQTLDRSINTQLTVVFTLLALALFGGVTIRHFVILMLIGLVSGTYSSIFNAAQLLVVWENGEIGKLFGRGKETTATVNS